VCIEIILGCFFDVGECFFGNVLVLNMVAKVLHGFHDLVVVAPKLWSLDNGGGEVEFHGASGGEIR
jgi:hypothetical protein